MATDYRYKIIRSIENIEDTLADYERNVLAAVHDYKIAMAKDLSLYVKDYQDSFRKNTRNNARTEIETAKKECQKYVAGDVETLRDICKQSISVMPDEKALSALRVFHDFGIPMTLEDVQTIAAQMEGCSLGMRALSSVAAASGWKVEIPVFDMLPAALDKLEYAMKTPERGTFIQIPEYVELQDGDHRALQIHSAAVQLNDALRGLLDIDDALTRQGVSIHAAKNETETEQGKEGQGRSAEENAVIISPAESEAERIARQIGIEKSTNEALTRAGTDHYTLKLKG